MAPAVSPSSLFTRPSSRKPSLDPESILSAASSYRFAWKAVFASSNETGPVTTGVAADALDDSDETAETSAAFASEALGRLSPQAARMKAAIGMIVMRLRINSSWLGFVPRVRAGGGPAIGYQLSAAGAIGWGRTRRRSCPGGHGSTDVTCWRGHDRYSRLIPCRRMIFNRLA